MFFPLRHQPERWLFTGFVALLLAPVVAQGINRPLAHVLASSQSSVPATIGALVIALTAWFVGAVRIHIRPYVAWFVMGIVALALTGVLHLGASAFITLLITASGAVALTYWLPKRLPEAIDGLLARHRWLAVIYVLMALLSVVQVSRVSVFMADPTRTDAQIVPGLKFLETHSCLTAYVRATELAHDRVDNLYLAERWPHTFADEIRPETPFSPFDVDEYFYPPPFLLIPELLTPLRGDFFAQRAAWFGMNGLLLAAAFWLGARAIGGTRWHRPLLLAPLLFASLPVLSVLQVGNAQGIVVTLAILAMLACDAGRPALGGFGLALATLAKVSPGIFGVILLAQKQWRAIAWTAGLGLLLLVITVLVYGTNPIISWITYAWPRLSSGEAFSPMLHHPESIAINLAPSGTPFKLALLGVDVGDPWLIVRRMNQVFTLCIVVLAIFIGRRDLAADVGTRTPRALAWIALLFLAALRSPFAPGYVTFGFMWLITLLSVEVQTWRGALGLLSLFAVLTILPPWPPEYLAVHTTLVTLFAIGLAVWLIVRRAPSASSRA